MTSKKLKSSDVVRALRRRGSVVRAKASAWFFKTEKGQYGHGDRFFGVTVPEQRRLAKEFPDIPIAEIEVLLKSKFHECRLTGLLILVRQYQKGDAKTKERIAKFYVRHAKLVNNWDLVDTSAPYILGDHLRTRDRTVLYRLARSSNLWERRIAILSTYAFIRAHQYDDTLRIARSLLGDGHDLIHKAAGWMLREVGKKSPPTLERFLRTSAPKMPRTMLRYAIEKFPEQTRKKYLAMR